MKISVVVRARNEGQHIEKLLLGLAAQSRRADEVILVDSGSADDTVAIARRHGCKIIEIDRHEFTFGRALNKGCAAATGDICVFVSAHVYPVYDTWLAGLVEPFADRRVALSYGRQRGGAENCFSEHQIFSQWFPATSSCPQKTYFCNNANCAIRKAVWDELPYDETLTGLEDLAWAKAAQARGGWLAYVAEAEIIHVHDETWEQVQNRYRREAIAMRSIDSHAKFSRLDFLWLLVRHILSDSTAAMRVGRFRDVAKSIALFRYNQMLGTYRGYNDPPDVSAELRARFYYPVSRNADAAADGPTAERHLIDYDALEAKARSGAIGAVAPFPDAKSKGGAPSPVVRLDRGDR